MKRLFGFFVIFFILITAGSVMGDGFIHLHRPPEMPPARHLTALAVKYHHVKVTVTDQAAVTEVDQVFYNPNSMVLEGTYIFPLPDNAAIDKFTLFIDGKNTEGELLDAQKARQIYENIVRQKKDPALLEYMGTRMFRCRVFPIPARGERRITMKYSELIKMDGGLAHYSYPLNTEKFSSKPLESVTVEAKIHSKVPIKNVYSPSHKIDVVRKGENDAALSFEEKNVTPDKDFEIYYTVAEKEFGLNILTYQTGDDKGYFMMMLSPKHEIGRDSIIDKDIVFVLDKSGSMSGKKMEQARMALNTCIRNLNEGDRFNIIAFSTDVDVYEKRLMTANKNNIDKACRFVRNVEALGGTNIDEALTTALAMKNGKPEEARPFIIIFLTDGEPTVGERDIKTILKNVKAKNTGNVRLFCFGIGEDINTRLLDRLAEENHGVPEYVGPKENLELKVENFYTKIANPVLSGINLEVEGMRLYDVFPRRLPDIFKGTQLTVFGRYDGDGEKLVKLIGYMNRDKKVTEYKASFGKEDKQYAFLPRLWAVRKIGNMLEEIRQNPGRDNRELKDSVISLSKRFGIMTPYTSFLVLEPGMRPGGNIDPRRGDFARDLRKKMELRAGAEPMEEADREFKAEKGRGGIKASKDLAKMKEEYTESELDQKAMLRDEKGASLVKRIESKTFYLLQNVWVDSEVAAKDKRETIIYMSNEYFKFIEEHKGVGKFLALGERVVVRFGGKVYEIKPLSK